MTNSLSLPKDAPIIIALPYDDKLVIQYYVDQKGEIAKAGVRRPRKTWSNICECYNYENIRELLTKGFEPIELRTICDKYEFGDFCDELTGNENKPLLVDKLVHFAKRGGLSRVGQLLNWAKERNIGMWKQCGEYCAVLLEPKRLRDDMKV